LGRTNKELLKYKEGDILSVFGNVKIISYVVLAIGLKIKVENKPGVLMKLSKWLSERYIPIKSINVHPCLSKSEKHSLIHICVGITSDMIDSFENVGSIRKMISDLEKEAFAISVERIRNI
jgi:uncharacterized protein with ACT and thioredoxin-like domain